MNPSENENKQIQIFSLSEMYRSIFVGSPDRQAMFGQICLVIVTEGTLYHRIDQREHRLSAGSVAVILPEHAQDFMDNSQVQGYFISYAKNALCRTSYQNLLRIYALLEKCIQWPVFHAEPKVTEVLREMCHSLTNINECKAFENDLSIAQNQLLTLLLTLCNLPQANQPSNLSQDPSDYVQFKHLIYSHLTDCKSTKDYADQMAMTPKSLNKVCRNAIGVTAKDLINERLLYEIRKQLILEDKTVEEVAVSLGFQTPSYLTRYFKQHSGETPLHYKKSRTCL